MPTPTITPTKVRPLATEFTQVLGAVPDGEYLDRRMWNGKVFKVGNSMKYMFGIGWQHYLDADGHWADIDTNYVPVDGGWEVVDAPFFLKVPQFADGEAYFEANVRFDVFEKKEILDAPIGMFLRASTAAHVQGELFDMDGNGRTDAIIYRNAYPQWNADLIYYARHGRAPRLEKLVRFNSNPNVDGQVNIPFDIRYTEDVDVEVDDEDVLPQAKKDAIVAAIAGANRQDQLASSRNDKKHARRAARQLKEAMRLRRRKMGAEETKVRTKKSIALYRRGSVSDMRGIGMRDFYIWDSGTIHKIKERIDVDYEIINPSQYRLTKILSATFFNNPNVVYPVYTDTVSTFYPDPNTETTSVDGGVGYSDNQTWDTTHDATDGTDAYGSSATAYIGSQNDSPPNMGIYRAILLFDTSGIDDTHEVTAADLSIYISTLADGDNDGQDYATVVSSTPASNTDITTADYDQVGDAINNPTKLSNDVDLGSMTASAYNTWTLNASGLAAIIVTGVSKFGIREGHDMEDAQIATARNRIDFATAETAGTTSDPKLVVTHAVPPPTTPTNFAVSAADASQDLTISWDDVSDETSYSIERSDDGSTGWTEVATPAANDTSWTDTTIAAWSTQKYYRMRSYNSGTSLYSSYTSTLNATTAPAAPTSPAVAAEDASNNLNLSWVDNSSDETGFEIQASDDGATGWSTVTTTAAAATTYAHNVGARDTQKYYRIRATRSGDGISSSWTSNVNATTAPADPTSIVLTPSSGQIEVAWTDNSSTESTFSIERKPSGGAYSVLTTDTASPYVDASGTEGITYYYKIRAYRASDGVYSGYATEQSSTVPPLAPTNLLASCTDDTPSAAKVQLTWQHQSENETGTKIERKLGAGAYSTVTTTAGGVSSYDDTGLTENSEYTYRISATAGGVFSSTIEATVTTLLGISSSLRHTFYRKINHLPY